MNSSSSLLFLSIIICLAALGPPSHIWSSKPSGECTHELLRGGNSFTFIQCNCELHFFCSLSLMCLKKKKTTLDSGIFVSFYFFHLRAFDTSYLPLWVTCSCGGHCPSSLIGLHLLLHCHSWLAGLQMQWSPTQLQRDSFVPRLEPLLGVR